MAVEFLAIAVTRFQQGIAGDANAVPSGFYPARSGDIIAIFAGTWRDLLAGPDARPRFALIVVSRHADAALRAEVLDLGG